MIAGWCVLAGNHFQTILGGWPRFNRAPDGWILLLQWIHWPILDDEGGEPGRPGIVQSNTPVRAPWIVNVSRQTVNVRQKITAESRIQLDLSADRPNNGKNVGKIVWITRSLSDKTVSCVELSTPPAR